MYKTAGADKARRCAFGQKVGNTAIGAQVRKTYFAIPSKAMAPPKQPTTSRAPARRRPESVLQRLCAKYVNLEFVKYLIFNPAALPVVTVVILLAELALNVIVIGRVPYTEIDWVAYMQECEGFLNGTTNYALLRGDTGPLVYPAAFVYIYSILYYLTGHGQHIRLAQYVFTGIYLLQMWLVLRLYSKSRKVPPYVLVISAFTSYRIHSIYVLRLFNDPVAVLFVYMALNLFMDRRWTLGSLCFSLAVGVKMNILLFAPALLLFYLANLGYFKTLVQLAICGGVQLLLGAPFLLTHPVQYLKGSFDLSRIFEHKWTVNYRFLPITLFENKSFHVALLAVHLLLLIAFAKPTLTYFQNYVRLRALQDQLQPQLARKNLELKQKPGKKTKKPPKAAGEKLSADQESFLKSFERSLQKSTGLKAPLNPKEEPEPAAESEESQAVAIHFEQCTQLALLPFFACNFIGLVCSRSLHYQFYVWYFHSLPYLTWSTDYSLGLRFLLLGLIEFCWNTYPSTNFSSATLHLCHLALLYGVGRSMFKTTAQSAAIQSQRAEREAAGNGTKNAATHSKKSKDD